MASTQSSRKLRGQDPDLSKPSKGKEKKKNKTKEKNNKGREQAGDWWRNKGE